MTVPCWIAGAAALLFVIAMVGPQIDDLRWRELHHAYWGALLAIAALMLRSPALLWPGALLLADDAWQHGVQRFLRRPWYRSPGHQLYGFLYDRWAWLRRLNAWLEQ